MVCGEIPQRGFCTFPSHETVPAGAFLPPPPTPMNTSTLGAILIAACVALVPVLFLVLLVKAPTALALLIFLLIVLAPVIFHLVVFAFFILAVLFMVRHW